jgi:hypothetical protein
VSRIGQVRHWGLHCSFQPESIFSTLLNGIRLNLTARENLEVPVATIVATSR